MSVHEPLDPLADAAAIAEKPGKHNRAKVGSGRPSSLLYTYGPGAVMDLPQFTIMPAGFEDWDRIWRRSDSAPPVVHAPRLRAAVATLLRSRDVQLRPFPWTPKKFAMSAEGNDLGVPARVFPQMLRCTGCDLLGALPRFGYTNTHPFRSDLACFEHVKCSGRGKGPRKPTRQNAVPARYLLVCVDGHLDEFPYDWWVHRGQPCAKADVPELKMVDRTAGKGASAIIRCESCELTRPMNEAQGHAGQEKLPQCRGRHPHLDCFEKCSNQTSLMLVGASNLWFAATESVIVMPLSEQERTDDLAARVRLALGGNLVKFPGQTAVLRALLETANVHVADRTDGELETVLAAAAAPESGEEEQERERAAWDPVDLLVPEWRHLQRDPVGPAQGEPSGLTLSICDRAAGLPTPISRVLAVESLRKVNALFGFTRIDTFDRVDRSERLAPLVVPGKKQAWTVATEDFGEGIFLQLDELAVAAWEARVLGTDLWEAHRAAHERNFRNRYSETAEDVHPDTRLRPPRYWLVHTLAHVLIRAMAMSCGYSAASLSERLYAWRADDGRPPAAGLLICTTASDSDGTLGGLVQQSEPDRLERAVRTALDKADRCSSDPICAARTPQKPEDFLHGAACHCCVMASETSCERANRFLDRRFLVDLPGSDVGFFTR